MIDSARARVSVLIGLVSTEDGDRILETLRSLQELQDDVACEVILVDRRQDAISDEIARRYPGVRLLTCPPNMTLPAMRTRALEAASADIVAVTEDHCVPGENWLAALLEAFEGDDVVAVGGGVDNGVTETSFDWATFLCEYSSFASPVAEGEARVLPGMNVAYRADALARIPRERLVSGFWETTAHPLLLANGGRFISRNAIKMNHCKKFSFGLFARQRYVYSRYYAGIRFRADQWVRRIAASAASVVLPPLLLWRMSRATAAKRLSGPFWRAFPALSALVVIWSVGEIVGYVAGPGKALAEIE